MFLVIFFMNNGYSYSTGDKQNTVNNSDLSIISKDGEIGLETNDSENEDSLHAQRDTDVQETVEEFRKMCPWTQLCSYNITGTPPSNPCCSKCSCADGCDTDCCPDKARQYLNKTQIRAVLDKTDACIILQYKPAFSNKAFNFTIKCPPSFNDESVKENCAQEYYDYNFFNGLFGFTPVSSNMTQKAYRNIYCARCHGENDSDLVSWQLKLDCSLSQPLAIESAIDIPNALNSREDCNILFESPPELTRPSYCYIDQCNITGLWKDYIAEIETACLSYTSIYKRYKNIHCYLCNGGEETKVEPFCPPMAVPINKIAFVAILDFRIEEYRVGLGQSYINTKCQEDSVYDDVRVSDNYCTMYSNKI